jgi:hypothetical protein
MSSGLCFHRRYSKIKQDMKKIAILSLIMLVFAGCTAEPENVVESVPNLPQIGDLSISHEVLELEAQSEDIEVQEEEKVEEEPLLIETKPQEDGLVNWPVPFAMQAPFSNWDMPYQEMCEEAALTLASKYFNNESISKQIMDDELTKVREWEVENLGGFTDSTVAEIKQMGEAVFSLDIEISEDVSIQNIKDQLDLGYLVLAPTAGRELHNPFFKQPGPLYHILVIRGYNSENFITNDVGIGKGEAYEYKYNVLINAVRDLPVIGGEIFRPYDEDISENIKEDEMKTGEKRILIVKGLK